MKIDAKGLEKNKLNDSHLAYHVTFHHVSRLSESNMIGKMRMEVFESFH